MIDKYKEGGSLTASQWLVYLTVSIHVVWEGPYIASSPSPCPASVDMGVERNLKVTTVLTGADVGTAGLQYDC